MTNKMENITNFLDSFEAEGLYPEFRRIENGANEPICKVNGVEYLMFSANNYLGMTQNNSVKKAAMNAIEKYGVGPGGSRVISGNIDVIEDLEKKIAELTMTEDSLTFPTGYMANIAIFQAMMDPLFASVPQDSSDGVIFSDEFNHGSIVDGCRLSKAKKIIFRHDDLDDLRAKIAENNLPNKLIVTEGVFSLDGEIINVPKYIEVAKEFNAKLMIDDAHGIGILGEKGGGIGEYHNCADGIDILMGCMDKAFGGTGGYLAGSKSLIKYLKIASRSSLLSSALPAGMAGGMIESVNQIKHGQDLRKNLFEKAKYLKESLIDAGFRVLGKNDIPSVPLFIGDEKLGIQFANILWEQKILSPIVRWPAVPVGQSRFRVIVMVDHSKEQLDYFIGACKIAGEKLGILK